MEVMMSFFLLSVMTAAILPYMLAVYEERLTIQEEKEAYLYVSKIIQEWLYEDRSLPEEATVQLKNTTYELRTEIDGRMLKVCLHWVGRNERDYTVCNYGKKVDERLRFT